MGDLISREALLRAYDDAHKGEPGAAAKAVEGVKNIGGSAVEGAKSLGEGVKNLGGGALKSLGIGK